MKNFHLCQLSKQTRSWLFPASLLLSHFFLIFSLFLFFFFSSNNGLRNDKRRRLVVKAGKAALFQTKRKKSRKSLNRTDGFRRRMRTTSGRAVSKRRLAKGRKVLCTKSNPNSGKR